MAGFPRMLFFGGIAGEPRLVHSDEEDAQARAEGYATFGEAAPDIEEFVRRELEAPDAPAPKRRGRPPKIRE